MAVVTISRQYGAGGWKIAEIIANRLGYKIFDQAIINDVAKKAKVSVKSVHEIEKTAGNFFLSLFNELAASLSFVRHAPGIKSDFDEERYRTFLKRTIREIAARSNAIIIGRGSQMILKDHPRAIRIYLVARDDYRIRNLMHSYGYDQKKAESIAIQEEKRRLTFLQGFGVPNPEDAHHYHMSINTSVVSDAKAADLICALVAIKEKNIEKGNPAAFDL